MRNTLKPLTVSGRTSIGSGSSTDEGSTKTGRIKRILEQNPRISIHGGNAGIVGTQGPIGAQGLIGPQGLIGDTGYEGPKGLRGNIGPIGDAGKKGPVGIDGKNSNIDPWYEISKENGMPVFDPWIAQTSDIPAFSRTMTGLVIFSGWIYQYKLNTSTINNTDIFILPEGFRPKYLQTFFLKPGNGWQLVEIHPDGRVHHIKGFRNTVVLWLNLSDIMFIAK